MFKVLKVTANNEQQKDLAALAICENNLKAHGGKSPFAK